MTEVLYQTFDEFHNLLVEYEFPNVPKEKANDFINDILDMYTNNLSYFDMDDINNFTKELLRQIIKSKRDKTNLFFLEDNQSFVIGDSVLQNYISRMVEFEDIKYFDNELSITNALEKMDSDYKKKLNVEFWDSSDHREIQICDVICGFVARLYNFLSHNSYESIVEFCNSLDAESEGYKTLHTFFTLMDISDKKSHICFKKTAPMFIERRFTIMLQTIMERKQ